MDLDSISRAVDEALASAGPYTDTVLQFVVELSVSRRLQWNIGYLAFILWLYLFHAPLKDRQRTDTYAQVTKIVQVWCGAHITLFHVMGLYLDEWQGGGDGVTRLFFPLFVAALFSFSLVHKLKRPLRMRLTYRANLWMLILNSLLVALALTVHTTYCYHRFNVAAVQNSIPERLRSAIPDLITQPLGPFAGAASSHAIPEAVRRAELFVMEWLTFAAALPPATAARSAAGLVLDRACPTPGPAASTPLTLLHLYVVGILCVLLDYAYKRLRNNDGLRGTLWAAEVVTKRASRNVGDAATANDGNDNSDDDGGERPDGEPMVSWYSIVTSLTAIQLTIKSTLNFLAFDFRNVEEKITPKIFCFRNWKPDGAAAAERVDMVRCATEEVPGSSTRGRRYRSACSKLEDPAAATAADLTRSPQSLRQPEKVDFWFDFVGDVGDGFNSTYAVAMNMAQQELAVRGLEAGSERSRSRFLSALWRRRKGRRAAAGAMASDGVARLRRQEPLRRANSFSHMPHESEAAASSSAETPTTPLAAAASPMSPFEDDTVTLPRGQFVLVGGDLCYPHPTDEGYRKRFFRPYDDALPKFSETRRAFNSYIRADPDDEDVAYVDTVHQTSYKHLLEQRANGDPSSSSSSSPSHPLPPPPAIFAIPGNHDWIDGCSTFRSMMLGKSWIGGWIMPQESTYFVLALPGDWHLLCLDNGLFEDIDPSQMLYFFHYIDTRLGPNSSVILAHHEPMWIHDHHYRASAEGAQPTMERGNKLARRLGPRLRMRVAGDIHNYSRYVATSTGDGGGDPMLVVSGGGGAFMHGTHKFPSLRYLGSDYKRAAAFPANRNLRGMLQRTIGFRVVNWQFDLVGGLIYFIAVWSLLPLPMHALTASGDAATTGASQPTNVTTTPASAVGVLESMLLQTMHLMGVVASESYVSLAMSLTGFVMHTAVMETKVALPKRLLYGMLWATIHTFMSIFLLVFLNTTLYYLMANELVSSSAHEWRSSLQMHVTSAFWQILQELQQLPVVGPAATAVNVAVLTPLCHTFVAPWITAALKCTDLIEGLAFLTHKVADPVTIGTWAASATRLDTWLYTAHLLFFYWVLATPVVSFLVGLWVVVSLALFDVGYDAAYAAFCIEDYKNFLRMWLTTDEETGEVVLHCFAIGIERVPRQWTRARPAGAKAAEGGGGAAGGSQANGTSTHSSPPPYCQPQPSRWVPWRRQRVPQPHVRTSGSDPFIVDHFVIRPTPRAPQPST